MMNEVTEEFLAFTFIYFFGFGLWGHGISIQMGIGYVCMDGICHNHNLQY